MRLGSRRTLLQTADCVTAKLYGYIFVIVLDFLMHKYWSLGLRIKSTYATLSIKRIQVDQTHSDVHRYLYLVFMGF